VLLLILLLVLLIPLCVRSDMVGYSGSSMLMVLVLFLFAFMPILGVGYTSTGSVLTMFEVLVF